MLDNIPVWALPPNWAADVHENLSWLTDVLASPTGVEQRRELRLSPRVTYEWSSQAVREERTQTDLYLMAWGDQDWYVPMWPYVTVLTATATNGDASVFAPVIGRQFEAGDAALLYHDMFKYELVEIDAVNDGHIVLTNGLQTTWPKGTKLLPVRRCFLTDQPSFSRINDGIWSGQVRFQLRGVNDYEEVVEDDYMGYPVLKLPPDEGQTMTFAYTRNTLRLDNDTGVVLNADQALDAFPVQQHSFFLHGVDEKIAFKNFLYSLRGRQKALWIPTFYIDFEVTSPIDVNDATFDVRMCGYTAMGGPASGRRFVRFEMRDGTNVYRRITASQVVSTSVERITVNEVFHAAINPDAVLRVSFMAIARMDQDAVDITHKTSIDGVAIALLSFHSLPVSFLASGWGFGWGANYGGLNVGDV